MNGHSKGPWRVVDGSSPGVLYVEGPPLPITIITTALDIDFAGSMEREANAHLIAAAPSMLYTLIECERVLARLDTLRHLDPEWPILDEVRSQIAKATGQA